jgi:PAS domain S-box-containing protein
VETRYNIIVLEKDPTEVELIEMQLRKAGLRYATKRISSPEMLPEAARGFPPHLILANFALPRFEVDSVITAAQNFLPSIPWVIYSLSGNEETAVQCMKAGASDFILKKHITRFGASVKGILEKAAQTPLPAPEPEARQPKELPAEKSESAIFRQIVEHAPDLIAVLNLEGRREYNNPMYGEVIEDPDILVGTDSFLDILSEDRDRIRALFNDIVKRGYGEQTEYRLLDKAGETRFIQSNSSIIPNQDGDPDKVVVISRDVTNRFIETKLFENMVAATAGVTGQDFYNVLVHRLCDAVGMRCALASYIADEDRKRVRSLAFWIDGALHQTVEYDIAQTPCEDVVAAGEVTVQTDGVGSRFPRIREILGGGVESYVGVPLKGFDNAILGHLFVADSKPLQRKERTEYIVRVMARRASVELQRALTPPPAPTRGEKAEGDEATKDLSARLRSAIEGFPMPILMTDEAGMIVLVNGTLEGLIGIAANDLLGRRAWPLVLRSGPWKLMKEEYPDTVIRADKSGIPVGVFAIPCRNSEGRISGAMAVLSPKTGTDPQSA